MPREKKTQELPEDSSKNIDSTADNSQPDILNLQSLEQAIKDIADSYGHPLLIWTIQDICLNVWLHRLHKDPDLRSTKKNINDRFVMHEKQVTQFNNTLKKISGFHRQVFFFLTLTRQIITDEILQSYPKHYSELTQITIPSEMAKNPLQHDLIKIAKDTISKLPTAKELRENMITKLTDLFSRNKFFSLLLSFKSVLTSQYNTIKSNFGLIEQLILSEHDCLEFLQQLGCLNLNNFSDYCWQLESVIYVEPKYAPYCFQERSTIEWQKSDNEHRLKLLKNINGDLATESTSNTGKILAEVEKFYLPNTIFQQTDAGVILKNTISYIVSITNENHVLVKPIIFRVAIDSLFSKYCELFINPTSIYLTIAHTESYITSFIKMMRLFTADLFCQQIHAAWEDQRNHSIFAFFEIHQHWIAMFNRLTNLQHYLLVIISCLAPNDLGHLLQYLQYIKDTTAIQIKLLDFLSNTFAKDEMNCCLLLHSLDPPYCYDLVRRYVTYLKQLTDMEDSFIKDNFQLIQISALRNTLLDIQTEISKLTLFNISSSKIKSIFTDSYSKLTKNFLGEEVYQKWLLCNVPMPEQQANQPNEITKALDEFDKAYKKFFNTSDKLKDNDELELKKKSDKSFNELMRAKPEQPKATPKKTVSPNKRNRRRRQKKTQNNSQIKKIPIKTSATTPLLPDKTTVMNSLFTKAREAISNNDWIAVENYIKQLNSYTINHHNEKIIQAQALLKIMDIYTCMAIAAFHTKKYTNGLSALVTAAIYTQRFSERIDTLTGSDQVLCQTHLQMHLAKSQGITDLLNKACQPERIKLAKSNFSRQKKIAEMGPAWEFQRYYQDKYGRWHLRKKTYKSERHNKLVNTVATINDLIAQRQHILARIAQKQPEVMAPEMLPAKRHLQRRASTGDVNPLSTGNVIKNPLSNPAHLLNPRLISKESDDVIKQHKEYACLVHNEPYRYVRNTVDLFFLASNKTSTPPHSKDDSDELMKTYGIT